MIKTTIAAIMMVGFLGGFVVWAQNTAGGGHPGTGVGGAETGALNDTGNTAPAATSATTGMDSNGTSVKSGSHKNKKMAPKKNIKKTGSDADANSDR